MEEEERSRVRMEEERSGVRRRGGVRREEERSG